MTQLQINKMIWLLVQAKHEAAPGAAQVFDAAIKAAEKIPTDKTKQPYHPWLNPDGFLPTHNLITD